jgi:hypothetical protein
MRSSHCVSALAFLGAIGILTGNSTADSIVIDGQKHQNVYITATTSMYLVSDPATGKVTTVEKSLVKSEDVQIDKDASARTELYRQWQAAKEANEKLAAEKNPPAQKTPGTPAKQEPASSQSNESVQESPSGNQPPAIPLEQNGGPIVRDQALREQIAANQAAARQRASARNTPRTQVRGITSENVPQQRNNARRPMNRGGY